MKKWTIKVSFFQGKADLLCDEIKAKLSIKRMRGDTFGKLQTYILGCMSDVDQREAREVGEKGGQLTCGARKTTRSPYAAAAPVQLITTFCRWRLSLARRASWRVNSSQAAMPTTAAAGGAWKGMGQHQSKTYPCEGSKHYGKTKGGDDMSEADVKAAGNHADRGKARVKSGGRCRSPSKKGASAPF